MFKLRQQSRLKKAAQAIKAFAITVKISKALKLTHKNQNKANYYMDVSDNQLKSEDMMDIDSDFIAIYMHHSEQHMIDDSPSDYATPMDIDNDQYANHTTQDHEDAVIAKIDKDLETEVEALSKDNIVERYSSPFFDEEDEDAEDSMLERGSEDGDEEVMLGEESEDELEDGMAEGGSVGSWEESLEDDERMIEEDQGFRTLFGLPARRVSDDFPTIDSVLWSMGPSQSLLPVYEAPKSATPPNPDTIKQDRPEDFDPLWILTCGRDALDDIRTSIDLLIV